MLKRIIWVIIGLAAVWFAVQGGQYGTVALFKQRSERRRLLASIDSLDREIDSLTKVRKALTTDAATQERIAREELGMVRGPKEILYRFADPADSARPARRDTTKRP